MELSDYQSNNIGWLLSDIISCAEIQRNGIASSEFVLTTQTMDSIAKFLKQWKNEVLGYESRIVQYNIEKIMDWIEIWQDK